ncbi:MAG: TetR/AcrR family transcriptional regulator, partial [Rhizomicrobium sp.]
LAEKSIDRVSVDDITQHAGVAKGSFFNHFADKREFASAIAMKIRIGVEVNIAAANRDVTDPALRVARGICSFVQFAFTQRLAAKTFARVYTSNIGATQPLDAGIRSDVALGVVEKRFSLTSTEAGVVCVTGSAQGLLASILTNIPKQDEAVTLSIDVITAILTGLGVDPNEARHLSSSSALSLIV